jgi:hypothetical protein
MPHGLPVFPTLINAWNPPSWNPGIPPVVVPDFTFHGEMLGGRNHVTFWPHGPNNQVFQALQELYAPIGTPLVLSTTQINTQLFEVPAGSGRFWFGFWASVVAMGFANAFFSVWCTPRNTLSPNG